MTIASAIKKMNSNESREYLLSVLQSSNINQNFKGLIFCLSKNMHMDLIDEKLFKNIFLVEGNKYTSYNYTRSNYLNKFNDNIKKAVDLIFENKEIKEKFLSLLRKEFLNTDGHLMVSNIWYVFKYYISKEDLKSFDEIIYAFVCDDVRIKDYEKYLNFYKKSLTSHYVREFIILMKDLLVIFIQRKYF